MYVCSVEREQESLSIDDKANMANVGQGVKETGLTVRNTMYQLM